MISGNGKERLARMQYVPTWGVISKYRNVLFGITICIIVIFHLYGPTVSGTVIHAGLSLFSHASLGVDMFLFLSGMGLYFAFSKNSSLKRFYERRVLRILPTFLIVAIPAYIWKDIALTPDEFTFVVDFFNISFLTDAHRWFWYIYAIFVFYAIFPLLYHWIFSGKYPLLCTCVIMAISVAGTIALGFFDSELLKNIEIMLTRFPVFVFGCYAGKLIKEKAALTGKQLIAIAIVGLFFWFISFLPIEKWGGVDIIRRYWYSCMAVELCVIIPLLLDIFGTRTDLSSLCYLGDISLEIYIASVAFRKVVKYYFGDYFFSTASNLIQIEYCTLIVVGTFILAVLLHKVAGVANNLVESLLHGSARQE